MVMPFGKDEDVYNECVKTVANEVRVKSKRVDENVSATSIQGDVIRDTDEADIVKHLADKDPSRPPPSQAYITA